MGDQPLLAIVIAEQFGAGHPEHAPALPPDARRGLAVGGLQDRHQRSARCVLVVQPVVGQSVRIYDTLLQRMDPELFKKLESLQIEPQMWGMCAVLLLC